MTWNEFVAVVNDAIIRNAHNGDIKVGWIDVNWKAQKASDLIFEFRNDELRVESLHAHA